MVEQEIQTDQSIISQLEMKIKNYEEEQIRDLQENKTNKLLKNEIDQQIKHLENMRNQTKRELNEAKDLDNYNYIDDDNDNDNDNIDDLFRSSIRVIPKYGIEKPIEIEYPHFLKRSSKVILILEKEIIVNLQIV
ncbi:hypothetical protein M0811_13477 [Anaeramoeba ignava]|uniref:Uncharacterized protein n=1 Tax=Anaeramoeba ignava TaxID=1746090 RepID=A0A9Q0L6Y5_ANAIG|nr:hypothetical protein M0811_13477 [Anaeramoeba ignava]